MITKIKIEPKFKVGDCVQLSSGGFKMTVSKLITRPVMNKPNEPAFTGYVECTWFEDNILEPANLQSAKFPQDALKLCPQTEN